MQKNIKSANDNTSEEEEDSSSFTSKKRPRRTTRDTTLNSSNIKGGELFPAERPGLDTSSLTNVTGTKFARDLLRYFDSPDIRIPSLLLRAPRTWFVDQVIDEDGHTALHWAVATGRLKVAQFLVQRGANPNAVNKFGHTALMRAVMYGYCAEAKNFAEMLDLLAPTSLSLVDGSKRNVVHHIALSSSSSSTTTTTSSSNLNNTTSSSTNSSMGIRSRYYLETLLSKLTTTTTSSSTMMMMMTTKNSLELRCLNEQDCHGDTPLHIFARLGNRSLARKLMDVGARPELKNFAGISAQSLLSQPPPSLVTTASLNQSEKSSSAKKNISELRIFNLEEASTSYSASAIRHLPVMEQVLLQMHRDHKRQITELDEEITRVDQANEENQAELRRINEFLKRIDVDQEEFAKMSQRASMLCKALERLVRERYEKELNSDCQSAKIEELREMRYRGCKEWAELKKLIPPKPLKQHYLNLLEFYYGEEFNLEKVKNWQFT